MPALPDNQLTADQHAALAEITAGPRGAAPGPFIPLLRSPQLMTLLQKVGEYLRFSSPLDRRLFEMTILVIARHWDQQFEWSFHHPLALEAGLASSVAGAIADGVRPAGMDEGENAVWDLLNELLHTRQVSAAAYGALLSVIGEEGVVEVVATAGYYTTLAMVMNVARTPAPDGPYLPERPGTEEQV